MGIHAPSRNQVPSRAATFVATDDTWLVSGHRLALPAHTVRSLRRCLHPGVKVPARSAWGTGMAPGDGCHPPFTGSLRLMRHAAQVFSIQLSNVLRQSGCRSTLNGARQDSKDRGRVAQQFFVDHAPVPSTPTQPSYHCPPTIFGPESALSTGLLPAKTALVSNTYSCTLES